MTVGRGRDRMREEAVARGNIDGGGHLDRRVAADELETQLLRQARVTGDATGWFDLLYAAGERGEIVMPWDRRGPHARPPV